MILDGYSRASVALTVLLVVLVVSGPMTAATDAEELAQAGEELVVGGQHSTASEFNAQQLTNLTVDGTGEDASVVLDDLSTLMYRDSFEDDALGTTPDGWTGHNGAESGVSDLRATDGTQSYRLADSGTSDGRTVHSLSSATTKQYSADIYADANGQSSLYLLNADTGLATIGIYQGDLAYYDDSWQTLSTAVDAGEWTSVTISDIDPSADTVTVSWDSPSASGSQADVPLRGDMPTSGYEEIAVSHYAGESDGYEAFFDDIRVGESLSPASGQYVGTHNVSNSEEAAINITQASNVSVAATVRTDGGTELGTDTITSTGNHTLTLADTSSDQLETVLDVTVTGDNPQFELADESILFTNHAPQADNLSPPGDTELSQESVEFTADISDQEFSTAQSDEVTAELFVDGESIDSRTVTSNQTVSITHELIDGGDREYYWKLTDSYGSTTTTQTRTLTVPNTLYLYTETRNSTTGQYELLNGTNTSVEVTITGSAGSVKEVTVNDGTVDMTGLPSDESYVFTVDPEGYYAREIYVESIYDQAAVFLLNSSKSAVENSLTVTDRTGQYDEPIITVERVINTSRVGNMPDNGDQWVTIGGDRLGASGFYVINLQQSSRYRFVVINQAGDERVLGEYTAKVDGEVPLEIGSINYDLGPSNNVYQWTTAATNESGNPAVSFAYADGSNQTDWVNVTFRYRNNSAVFASSNFTTGPYGELQYTEPVDVSEYNNREFVVKWEASRGGEIISGEQVVGGKRTVAPPLSGVWMEIAYGTGVFLLAFLVGAGAGAPAAAVTVSVFAGLSVFIGLAPPALGFGATILALFLSVTMLVYGSADPPV